MDELVFFLGLGLAALAVLACGPIAFGLALAQRRRIAVLEERLARFERTAPVPAAPVPQREPVHEAPRPAAIVPPIPAPRLEPATRPPRPSFEERFGTRWTVWVGGIALAFGAALLVRYSVEAGYFGPALRMALGFALAFAMLAAGEVLRRRLRGSRPVPPTWPDIPAMVTAAGTVALFGAIYAAYALYGFIGPELAFVMLGATGLAVMVAALLHGPSLAGIGVVGALATPLLVGKGGGSAWPLTLYLPVVAASAYGFAWLKGWRALAVAAGLGAGAWALLLGLAASDASAAAAALVHGVLQAALASLTFALPIAPGRRRTRASTARRPSYC